MKANQRVLWFKITVIIISSVCLAFIWNNPVATASNSNKQQYDSTIVYYSYHSGDIAVIKHPVVQRHLKNKFKAGLPISIPRDVR